MTGRDYRVDNVKGGLMLLVIFGHMIEPLLNYNPVLSRVYNFIYLFHIPAFVFFSGFLNGADSKNQSEKIVNGLVIPLIFFSFVYEIPDLLLRGDLSGYIKALTPNWILWFLVSLISWRAITPILIRVRFILFFAIAASILISLLKVDGYLYGAFLTIIFYPFYLLGVMFSDRKEILKGVEVKPLLYAFAAILMAVIATFDLPFSRYLLYCVAPFSAFGYTDEAGIVQRIEYYVIAAIGIFLFSIISSPINAFKKIGESSLYVYLWHGLIVKYLLWPYVLSNDMSTISALGTALLCSIVLGYSLSSRPVVISTNWVLERVKRLLIKNISYH